MINNHKVPYLTVCNVYEAKSGVAGHLKRVRVRLTRQLKSQPGKYLKQGTQEYFIKYRLFGIIKSGKSSDLCHHLLDLTRIVRVVLRLTTDAKIDLGWDSNA